MERLEELRLAGVAGGGRWVRKAEVVKENRLMGGNGSGDASMRSVSGSRDGELGIRKSDDAGGSHGNGNAEHSVRKERTSSVVGNVVDLNSGRGSGDGASMGSKLIGTRNPRPGSSVEEIDDLGVHAAGGQNVRKEASFVKDGDKLGETSADIDERSFRKESTASVAGKLVVKPNSKPVGTGMSTPESDGDDVNKVGDQIVKGGGHVSVEASLIPAKVVDECEGRYVYEHKLDPYFNLDLLKQCKKLNIWQDLCPMLENGGLGPKLDNTLGAFSDSDWYQTNQFMLEEIFHNRMRRYKCLTNDSKQADAIFVPFYAGLEISMNLWGANITVRDTAPNRLFNWLTAQPEWKRFNGHDHFLVGGRITWDFRRETDEEKDWGNKLFVLPPSLNMTMLAIEASPFHHNDVAVPYPTYFHPSSKQSIQSWQARMRTMERKSLFSFVGAPRPNYITDVRGKIIHQCIGSSYCRLLNCSDDNNRICSYPENVMEVFEHSVFCLQPTGDSYTRRSTFDSMLAGCIPVFFHEFAAYSQYVWHLPGNHSSYSVYINVNTTSIEEALLKYSKKEIQNMREVVIQTIPAIVYSDPRSSPLGDVRDAFDISLQVSISYSTTSSGFCLDTISAGFLFVSIKLRSLYN